MKGQQKTKEQLTKELKDLRKQLAALKKAKNQRKAAEEALTQLLRQNDSILNSAGEGIYGVDRNGHTTFVNPAAARMLGWQPEELHGKPQHAVIHHTKPDGRPYSREECPICAAFKDGKVHRVDNEVFWRKDGTSFPVEYTSTPIRDEQDRLEGAVVTFRDITERKRAEEEVRTTQKMLSEAERLAHAGSFQWDIAANKVTWSDGLYHIYGLKPQEFGASFEAFVNQVHPDSREMVRQTIETAYRDCKPFQMEERTVRPDGEIRVLFSKGEVITNEQGTPVRMVGCCQDVTERKQAEEELLNSKAQLGAVLDTVGEGIITIDSSSIIVMVNREVQNIWGHKQEELIGKKLHILMPEKYRGLHTVGLKRYLKTGVAHVLGKRLELEGLKKDGTTFPLEIRIAETKIGQHLLFTAAVRDITKRKQAEEAIRRANEELERKVEHRTRELREKQTQLVQSEKMASLGQLVAGVAHEINTPLGALKSNIDIFMRSVRKVKAIFPDPKIPLEVDKRSELAKLLENIEELNAVNKTATDRIVAIVSSLRNFARLDMASLDVVDIHEGLENTLTLVHHELKNRVEVHKNYGKLPPIKCYPNQLNQVFLNLLVNASHAIKGQGKIFIKTRTRASNGTVIIEFQDTGVGIADEDLSRIFDPGFTTKGVGVGTGLGLSIVYQIIEEHKGKIEVESKVGKGTTFRLILPVK